MASAGGSSSWRAQQANVLRLFEVFRTSRDAVHALFPLPWDDMDERVLCERDVYARFATFLAEEYIIETGQYAGTYLSGASACNYLASLMNQTANRFKAGGNAETKLFFTCHDSGAGTDE